MKNSFLFLILLASSCATSTEKKPENNSNQKSPAESKDHSSDTEIPYCENFKTGEFVTYADTLKIVVKRDENFQYEKTSLGESKYKVIWTSGCAYDLTLIETTIEMSKKNIGKSYHIIITKTEDNEYSFSCRMDKVDFVYKGVIQKTDTLELQ